MMGDNGLDLSTIKNVLCMALLMDSDSALYKCGVSMKLLATKRR